ncbi:MAG TPA: sigma factor-like helix-turn-helix DNA-binding protein [Ilumatobacteraceae bacterium]|nr:sigma factor-like helix-turn-helix DNA-binding protein [Ilumatobacteraceae bacterium]
MGDTSAGLDYVEFYDREYSNVVHSVRPLVGAAAEDVTQEAFVAAFGQWDTVAELGLPVAWVKKVAMRLAWRAAQRERVRADIEQHSGSRLPPAECDLDLIAALADLPDRHEAAVWLHHMEDRPVADVADLLGCSVGATKVLLMRARQLLAKRLRAVDGRWVSELNWTRTAIARRIASSSRAEYIEPILDDDLGGVGGRWELSISGGSYLLERDDGLRLDHGRFEVRGTAASIDPVGNPGEATFRLVVDADRLRIDRVLTTLPPTRGVPDTVWLDLFFESGPMRYAGSARL